MAFKRKFSRRKFSKSRRGKYSRKGRQSFQSRVRKVIAKAAETKYILFAAENIDLYHDRGTVSAGLATSNQGAILFNPWSNISKGTNSNNRIADECYPRGLSLRLLYTCSNTRAAQFVRVIVAVLPKTFGTTILTGDNYDFIDAGSSNDTVTGMIRKEGIKVLYDKMITLQRHAGAAPTDTAAGDTRFFKKIWIKSKKGSKLSWQQDGNMANKPMALYCIPYENYGTLRSSVLGTCSYTCKCYFKDV